MSIWFYADRYEPVLPVSRRITLGEGHAPCLRSRRIGPDAELPHLWFQVESVNPTGSYKDRFAALAISHMIQSGAHTCLATSSGNTGSALAAYCASVGIRCRIAVVETAPLAKLQQMTAYGAELDRVSGFGTDAVVTRQVIDRVAEMAQEPGFAIQVSAYHWSPLGMQGVESISHELADRFPQGAGHIFCPAGGGGLTLAIARGFQRNGVSAIVHCAQPEGNDTIATPLREGRNSAREVSCSTEISGLQVASVIDGDEVITACRESGGTGHTVTEAEVYEAQKRLAREEGIFCEPAGAVALAAALNAKRNGELDSDTRVVCLVTGSGFKDASSIDRMNTPASLRDVSLDSLFRD